MRSFLATTLIALSLAACCSCSAIQVGRSAGSLSEDEKHRLYAAALAASDSPLDTEIFRLACQKIGVFDAGGRPNDKYQGFVSEHVNWSMTSESESFRREINTRERASDYVTRHLPQ